MTYYNKTYYWKGLFGESTMIFKNSQYFKLMNGKDLNFYHLQHLLEKDFTFGKTMIRNI